MSENKNIEDVLQNIPEYEKLTDSDKLILVMTIKNFISQHVTEKEVCV